MAGMPRLVTRGTGADLTRADQIAEVVQEALVAYREMINSRAEIRSVNIDVKMRSDDQGVRTVIVSLQGELEFAVRRG